MKMRMTLIWESVRKLSEPLFSSASASFALSSVFHRLTKEERKRNQGWPDWIRQPTEDFHRMRNEGVFSGHEEEWVVIKDGNVLGYFESLEEAQKVKYGGGAVIFAVDDKNMPVYRM